MRNRRQRRAWSWRAPLQFDLTRAQVFQEVLAGIMGWQTVVTSFAYYAALFVDDDDLDKNATAEIFMLVAGVSTIVFGLATDLPFLVAPSVLYVARETGITMGGQLAAQALANAAATVVFACTVKLDLVSYIPTALRIGAGCGVAMLVGVLGMRSVGLLVAEAFILPPFTWETAVGLAVVTAASTTTPTQSTAQKWIYVMVVPQALTVAVYAIIDMSKFQGYSSEDGMPLSHWRDGSLGLVDFSALLDAPGSYSLYIVRTSLSIVINISSVLLVLIDTVCLQRFRGVWRSAGETDFSDAIGGTTKFRRMACAIPMMSFIGNLAGVTTQAAFVESMIIVFAGGKTGLSAVVAGSLFVLSTVIWPLLPVIVPAHISGALTIVVTLRFFTVIRLIDVAHTSNLLMFGIPVVLVPFSFDFVDALCVATVLGFLCGVGNKTMSRKVPDRNSKVLTKTVEVGVSEDMIQDFETRRSSITRSKAKKLSTIGDGNTSTGPSLPRSGSGSITPEPPSLPQSRQGRMGLLPLFARRHKVLPNQPASSTTDLQQIQKGEETKGSEEVEQETKSNPWCRVFDLFSGCKPRQSCSCTTKNMPLSVSNVEQVHNANLVLPYSTSTSYSAKNSPRPSTSGGLRQVDAGTSRSRMRIVTVPVGPSRRGNYREWASSEIESVIGPTVHWKLAFVAAVELALKVISDQLKV